MKVPTPRFLLAALAATIALSCPAAHRDAVPDELIVDAFVDAPSLLLP